MSFLQYLVYLSTVALESNLEVQFQATRQNYVSAVRISLHIFGVVLFFWAKLQSKEQTSVFRLGVDFFLHLSQQEQQQEEPSPMEDEV